MNRIERRYLDLLRKSLVNELYIELEAQLIYCVLCGAYGEAPDLEELLKARSNRQVINHLFSNKVSGDSVHLKGIDELGNSAIQPHLRNYVEYAHTLLGHERLTHLEACLTQIVAEGIKGDVLQAGCWRGGSAVFLRGVLDVLGESKRRLWVADSFSGLPASTCGPDIGHEMDASVYPVLSVSLDEVKEVFNKYDLLTDGVEFLPGWFSESLRHLPAKRIALLHIDADLYESTLDVLNMCYTNVVNGGFIVIDDYGILPPCREAVDEFLSSQNTEIVPIRVGDHAAYWRRV